MDKDVSTMEIILNKETEAQKVAIVSHCDMWAHF